MPLDEAALRRPEFSEGHKLALADGQEWTFPKPVLRWFPSPTPEGGFSTKQSDPYGAEFQAGVERLMEPTGAEPDAVGRRIDLQLMLAATLLSKNYRLEGGDYEALLSMENTPENYEMWQQIKLILIGVAPSPKPEAVGSE